jgi:hypothetical protein
MEQPKKLAADIREFVRIVQEKEGENIRAQL